MTLLALVNTVVLSAGLGLSYVGGYFLFGHDEGGIRVFHSELTYDLYQPAIQAEQWIRGGKIISGWNGPPRR